MANPLKNLDFLSKKFAGKENFTTFAIRFRKTTTSESEEILERWQSGRMRRS